MTPQQKNSFSFRAASLLVKYPKTWILLALVLAAAAVPGLQKLQSDFSYRIWFRSDDPLLAEFDAFERRFGNDESIAVVVHSDDGIFDVSSLQLLQKITAGMWQVPEIIRVDSLTNYNWTHGLINEDGEEEMRVDPLIPEPYEAELTPELIEARKQVALNHEVIPGYLVSRDGKTAVVFGHLKPAIDGSPNFEEVVTKTRALLAPFLLDSHEHGHMKGKDGHDFYITGGVALTDAFREVTIEDMKIMLPMLLGAIVIFLFFTFRNLSGLALPFLVIFMTIAMTMGISGWIGIKINNTTSIVPHILVAISIADAVHILVTYFQYRRKGFNAKDATLYNLTKNMLPMFLTSLTTSVGLFSFATAKVVPVMTMGLLAGMGALIAWVLSILLVGPLLVLLPIKVKAEETPDKAFVPSERALRYTDWLMRNRKRIIYTFLVLSVICGGIALQNEINSDPFKYFAKTVPTRMANEFIEQEIGGSMALEITLDAGEAGGINEPDFLKKAEAFQDWLNALPFVTKTVSVIDIVKQINRTLHNEDPAYYVLPDSRQAVAEYLFLYTMSLPQNMDLNDRMTLDNDMIRLSVMWTLHSSKQSLAEMEVINAKAEELGLTANITGKMPIWHGLNPMVVQTFLVSIILAVVLVSLIMIVVFKSWRVGLMSMVPNLLPIIYGLALMTMLGTTLDMGTVIVASVCLGISVDDTIHFITNFTRWIHQGESPKVAVAQVLTHTFPALLVTTLVLVAGFGTFAFASFMPNVNFGIMCAIILSTALVADVVFLPALLLSSKAAQSVEDDELGEAEPSMA